jgi:uncharacterized protein (DUF2147 family)
MKRLSRTVTWLRRLWASLRDPERCSECGLTRQIGKLLAVCMLGAVALTGAEAASPADGQWMIKNLIINIFDCANLVRGRIVWLGEPAKRASQCGRTIIWGLKRQSPSVWTGGSILDPNDGKTYRLSATYEPDGTLRAQIFIGVPIFGKTEILKRIDTRSLPGLC